MFVSLSRRSQSLIERLVRMIDSLEQNEEDPRRLSNLFAMDHLVTYQYWAIVMLLWSASPFGGGRQDAPALVIDEINSRMWDTLRLGHLAIKERVGNLIRWGFFAEQTIKKHKAVSLTPVAGSAISENLAATKPLLHELYIKLVPQEATA